jgi:phytoene dehydrogenase-like protein
MKSKRIVVIGAGVGGLKTAAALARLGHAVTVLEAHIYPGGVAGTFSCRGYRFDAGATLAAGFCPGKPIDLVGRSVGIRRWTVEPLDPFIFRLARQSRAGAIAGAGSGLAAGSLKKQCPRRIDHADR